MSAEIKVLAKGLPTTLPDDAFSYLIGVLTGSQKLERMRGVKSAYDLVGYLLNKFLGEATVASTAKAKRVSKKQIAAALEGLCETGGASAKAFPAWLIPVLLDLAQKWIENRK